MAEDLIQQNNSLRGKYSVDPGVRPAGPEALGFKK